MNSEIIQRLQRSFAADQADDLKLELPGELWNTLMMDAHARGEELEDRAINILNGAYSNDNGPLIEKLAAIFEEKIDLEDRLSNLKADQDVDFLLYYNKVVLLNEFAHRVLAEGGTSDGLSNSARNIVDLTGAEIDALRGRANAANNTAQRRKASRAANIAEVGPDQADELE